MALTVTRNKPDHDWDWEFVIFRLKFLPALKYKQRKRIEHLVEAWFWSGYYGEYGGALLGFDIIAMSSIEFVWDLSLEHVFPDPQIAFDGLVRSLERFAEREKLDQVLLEVSC